MVSHRVRSALCYCILSEKGKVLSSTTGQNQTADRPRNANIQEQIRDYHVLLEATLGSEYLGTSLVGYDSFINNDEEGTEKFDPNKEEYQGLPDYPEIDDIIDNSDEKRAANSYYHYIGDVVLLPNFEGGKLMVKSVIFLNMIT